MDKTLTLCLCVPYLGQECRDLAEHIAEQFSHLPDLCLTLRRWNGPRGSDIAQPLKTVEELPLLEGNLHRHRPLTADKRDVWCQG